MKISYLLYLMEVCNLQISACESYIITTATIRVVYISRSYVFRVVWNVIKKEKVFASKYVYINNLHEIWLLTTSPVNSLNWNRKLLFFVKKFIRKIGSHEILLDLLNCRFYLLMNIFPNFYFFFKEGK